MAQIHSEKPIKVCPICKKEVRNLGLHIANIHPKALEYFDEYEQAPKNSTESNIIAKKAGSIGEMVKEHLDTMLNLQLIQMLGQGGTIKDVQNVLNPTEQKTAGVTIADVKEYHDLVYKENQDAVNINVSESDSAGWMNVFNNALPIVNKLMDSRTTPKTNNEENKENDKHRTTEERTIRPIGFIQKETPIDSEKPRSVIEESRIVKSAEQQDNRSDTSVSTGLD